MLKNMNLPNKLTILRIILVPVFVVLMCLPAEWNVVKYVALGIYVLASITDILDGAISRKKGIVTKFGKIMDPLADKLLVSSGFIMLTGLGVIPAWITFIIIFRDFFVDALRMLALEKGEDVAAGLSGKIKTIFQMIGIVLAILSVALGFNYNTFAEFISSSTVMSFFELFVNVFMTISISAAVICSIWSMVDYIFKFKSSIDVTK